MAIELRQQLKLTQQLIMTPQLQMAIKLLQLSRLELMDAIRQELEENPALEEVQESISPEEQDRGDDVSQKSEEKEVTIEEKLPEDTDWSNYIDEYNTPGKVNYESEARESPRYEAFIAQKESLSDHLLWQFLMTSPTPEEENIGSLIIGNLNRNGFLDVTVEDIAEMGNAPAEQVESVLSLMQTFDPVGVCARNLSESLLIQAEHFGCRDPIVFRIIRDHLPLLENRNYKGIARALKTGIERVVSAVSVIKGLDPRPGLQYNEEQSHYITPDIYVYKVDGDFVTVLNDDGMPRLRVSQFYQNSVCSGEAGDSAKDYMQEKMRSAAWLIKSIHQRQKTIYRVMESILKFQRDFFDKGIAYLKPLILRDVAEDIDMHESTISRVTTNKYAYTPQGIFELKYFFNSSINRVHGDAVASASVQDRIRQIIESENPKKPCSDDKISKILKKDFNISIARRTVAKYREMMRILPSNKRKQF
ncbi:MAG: RNA polymerase factor sigma-54 [Desulfococcaceae bacterium]|jgi:RNA polymerase sigma-54 factor|nr:RNA polymerase factor sigma-54 [Desulfococcaceae bacterium]